MNPRSFSGGSSDTKVLLRRLEAVAEPTPGEREILSNLPGTVKHYRAHDDIVRLEDRPSVVCLMLEGMTARYKISADGKRQIMSFHIPGDMPDLCVQPVDDSHDRSLRRRHSADPERSAELRSRFVMRDRDPAAGLTTSALEIETAR